MLAFDKPLGFEGARCSTWSCDSRTGIIGLARLRLAMTTDPTGDELHAAALPQAAFEIGAVLEAAWSAVRHLSDPAVTAELAQSPGHFDPDGERQRGLLAAVDDREPEPALVKVSGATNPAGFTIWIAGGGVKGGFMTGAPIPSATRRLRTGST